MAVQTSHALLVSGHIGALCSVCRSCARVASTECSFFNFLNLILYPPKTPTLYSGLAKAASESTAVSHQQIGLKHT